MATLSGENKPLARDALLIAFWTIVQLVPLALASGRVPLSARFFQPAERMAVEETLVVQLLVASLTFPLLMRSAFASWVIMITAIPMVLLANALSRYPLAELWPVMIGMELCLLTMAVWARMLQISRSQLIGVCVSSGCMIFLTVLWYLSREYQPESRDWLQYLSPIVAALRILDGSGKIWAFAALPGIFLAIGIIALVLRRSRAQKT